MAIRDTRTEEQKKAETVFVNATDSFMSGWGKCRGGKSYYCIACTTPEQMRAAFEWLNGRADMKRVHKSGLPRTRNNPADDTKIVPFEDTAATELL